MAGSNDRTYPVGKSSPNLYITYKLMFNFLKQEIMKRLLLLAPIAALALASCSNDEQIAQSPALNAQELTFRPAVNGTTRTVITDANFTGFRVEANITNNPTNETKYQFWQAATAPTSATDEAITAKETYISFDVSKSTAGKWELIDGKNWYWSSKNAEATFLGYNHASGSITVPNNISTVKAATDVAGGQKDVLVAYNKGVASSFDNGVPMLFRHVMSQIVIKADNKDANIRQIKVAAVRIHGVGNTNTLAHPSSETTADKFKWYAEDENHVGNGGYKPWAGNPETQTDKYYYYKGTTAPNAGTVADGGSITLNPSAQEITFDGAALLLPQTRVAATNLTTAAANGAYIDVLVQVQDLTVTPDGDEDYDKHTAKAIFPKINTTEDVDLGTEPNDQTIDDQKFAWVAVPVDIAWNPGYKYTYVLHFSKDGIGKVSPDEEGGEDVPEKPGEEIVDNPVPLYFTVIIDEWNDVEKTEKDL